MRSWTRLGRLTATAALTALVGGLGLVAAGPAQAAGTTLKLDRVRCIEETDEIGSDSPYVLVFATSPTNPSATAFGVWGPGGWDNAVDTGDTYYPNATIATGVHAGWTLWSVLLEEDNANDLTPGYRAWIANAIYNKWQVAFWHAPAAQQFEMTFGIISAVDHYLDNDDIAAVRKSTVSSSSAGFDVSHNGDGGAYWLRFKLV